MTACMDITNHLEDDVAKRKCMEPTSRKDTSALRTPAPSVLTGSLSGTDRQMRISKVAYYKAQQRGFAPGHDWEDWFAAEREVTGSR
jgi:hypothetical protein